MTATARGEQRKTTTSATSSAVTSRRRLEPTARSAHLLLRAPRRGGPVRDQPRRALGPDHAGVHDRDAHTGGPELVGEVGGERGDGDVADGARDGARPAGVEAGDADDPTVPLGRHVRGHGACAAQVPQHLGVEVRVDLGVGDVLERGHAPARGLGRRVDQHVDAAPRVDHLLDHGPHGRVVGRVGGDGEHLGAQPGGGRPQALLVPGDDRDPGALHDETPGHREADPLRTTGDDRARSGQSEVHSYGTSTLLWLR